MVPTKTGRPREPWAISAPSVGGVDAVGAVVGLGDHRREGGAGEGEVHLVADLLQAGLDDAEGDGVEGHRGAVVRNRDIAREMLRNQCMERDACDKRHMHDSAAARRPPPAEARPRGRAGNSGDGGEAAITVRPANEASLGRPPGDLRQPRRGGAVLLPALQAGAGGGVQALPRRGARRAAAGADGLRAAGAGRTSGLVAWRGGEPVGWCAVEPRNAYPGLLRVYRVPWAGRSEDKADGASGR